MTSEERALNLMEWLNTDDEEYIATLDKIKDMFNQHAAEARAEQAEKCGDEIAKLENIITRAVGWWLLEGCKQFDDAPAWLSSVRKN